LQSPKERILIIYNKKASEQNQTINDNDNIFSTNKDFIYSDDFFATKIVGVKQAAKFFKNGYFNKIYQIVNATEGLVTIYKSTVALPIFTFKHYCRFYNMTDVDEITDYYHNNFNSNYQYGDYALSKLQVHKERNCDDEYIKYDNIDESMLNTIKLSQLKVKNTKESKYTTVLDSLLSFENSILNSILLVDENKVPNIGYISIMTIFYSFLAYLLYIMIVYFLRMNSKAEENVN